MSGERPPAGEVQVGQSLGSYVLEALLGEGSMGRVFQARHALLDRRVALKILRPQQARDAEFVQRFFQEAKAVNQINHEHIVEIFDFVDDRESDQVYCVMELLVGETLSASIARGPIPLERMQRIAIQLCAALGAAHQVGVVHRDLKPDNIFIVQRPGQPDYVKVLDFGVAKMMSAVPTRSTLEGTLIGTPTYMAPEQAAGLPIDSRADIYAVGNVLYEMIVGKPPFDSEAIGQLVVQIITQPVPPLPSRLRTQEPLPSSLRSLVMRCLQKDPGARPAHLAEVTTGLLTLGTVSGRMLPVAGVGLPRVARPRQLAGLAALTSLGLLSAALALGGRQQELPTAQAVAPHRTVPVDARIEEPARATAAGDVVSETLGSIVPASLGSKRMNTAVPQKRAAKSARVPLKVGARDAIIDPFAP